MRLQVELALCGPHLAEGAGALAQALICCSRRGSLPTLKLLWQ